MNSRGCAVTSPQRYESFDAAVEALKLSTCSTWGDRHHHACTVNIQRVSLIIFLPPSPTTRLRALPLHIHEFGDAQLEGVLFLDTGLLILERFQPVTYTCTRTHYGYDPDFITSHYYRSQWSTCTSEGVIEKTAWSTRWHLRILHSRSRGTRKAPPKAGAYR